MYVAAAHVYDDFNMDLSYDANGNTTTKTDSTGTTTYSWDFENRLSSVTLPGQGGIVSYRYDPFGRRIYKSSNAGTSIYAYEQENLIEETNGAGAVVARYTQMENVDEPLAMLRSGTTSYYEADGLASITSLSNATGALAQTYTFDSFGNQTASSGSLTNPFRYTAREFDTETNLQFSRARYYDPQTGRFLSEDPLEFFGFDVNFYRYVWNNAVLLTDPRGLSPQSGQSGSGAGSGGGCSTTPCFAQLKYRPTAPGSDMTHSSWYVQGSDGKQWIVTAGPSNGSLNVWKKPASGDPELSSPVWFKTPLSSGVCAGVDNLLKAADGWPQNKIPYNWQGPNSNSAANQLGAAGGFYPSAPPGSRGWGAPVPKP